MVTYINLQKVVRKEDSSKGEPREDLNPKIYTSKEAPREDLNPRSDASESISRNESLKLELKSKVDALRRAIEDYSKCNAEVSHQRDLIENLEKKLVLQEKEFKLHACLLRKEKERALKSAQFATQKLLETVADFQRQVQAQKRVQVFLAGMVEQKDAMLNKCFRDVMCFKLFSYY